jgi:phosphotransferase system enzyme I (PtsI)
MLHLISEKVSHIPKNDDAPISSSLEMHRFSSAVSQARSELQVLLDKLRGKGFSHEADLVDVHLQMTSDPVLHHEVEKGILQEGKRADDAVAGVIEQFRGRFRQITQAPLQQRFDDIEGVCLRILSFLSSSTPERAPIPPHSVVFAKTLTAPIVAEASVHGLGAIVTTSGGAMSHTAIVAKARGIPYVTNIQAISLSDACSGASVIVDGLAGLVVVRPTSDTMHRYLLLKEAHEASIRGGSIKVPSRGMTKDAEHISMMANVSGVSEVSQVLSSGLDGVGLYRTEYQVLELGRFPTEQEQEATYVEMVRAAQGNPVVIRVFDFGSDKNWDGVIGTIPDIKQGRRTIDVLLNRPQIFLSQIRAMLRASTHGPLSILFPMISSIEELDRCLAVLQRAYEMVREEGPVPKPRCGVMVELPALAFRTHLLSGRVDFLSLGTNDLIQYSLAVDRSNGASFDLCLSCHAGLLQLLRLIVQESQEAQLPLCVCGEMASDPLLIPFLVGIGVRGLSIAPRLASLVRHVLAAFTIEEARNIAQTALSLTSAQEIYNFLRSQYCKINENSY